MTSTRSRTTTGLRWLAMAAAAKSRGARSLAPSSCHRSPSCRVDRVDPRPANASLACASLRSPSRRSVRLDCRLVRRLPRAVRPHLAHSGRPRRRRPGRCRRRLAGLGGGGRALRGRDHAGHGRADRPGRSRRPDRAPVRARCGASSQRGAGGARRPDRRSRPTRPVTRHRPSPPRPRAAQASAMPARSIAASASGARSSGRKAARARSPRPELAAALSLHRRPTRDLGGDRHRAAIRSS